MKLVRLAILACTLLWLGGCSDGESLSQQELKYLSHVDQAVFFQRQGELKASTLEARNAMELRPDNPTPYLIVAANSILVGDGFSALRHLEHMLEVVPSDALTDDNQSQLKLLRAEGFLLEKRFEEALAELDALKPSSPSLQLDAALLRGRILLAAGQPDDAREAYGHARELDADSVDAIIGLSRVAWATDKPALARSLITEASELANDDAELWLWKAEVAQAEENWKDAESAYFRALEDIGQYDVMTQRKYQTMSALIEVLRKQGKAAEAFVYHDILAKSAPGALSANLTAASQAMKDNDLDTATRYLEEVLAEVPEHPQGSMMLGLIYFRQGRAEEAARLLEPIVESRNIEEARKLLAAVRIQMNDPDGARKLLDSLEGKQQDPEIEALTGIASLASGDFDAGEALIESSLSRRPDNHSLRMRYARYLMQQGKIDEAIGHARQLTGIPETSTDAWTVLVQAYLADNNVSAARQTADEWIKAHPDDSAALLARGELAQREGRLTEAASYFQRAEENSPGSVPALLASAGLAVQRGDTDSVRAIYQRLASLAADNLDLALRVSSMAFNQGLESEGLNVLRQAKENHPDSPKPLLAEARYLSSKGDHTGAARLYRLALTQVRTVEVELSYALELFKAGDRDGALGALGEASARFMNEDRIPLTRALLAQRANQPETAITAYEQVLDRNENNLIALNNLALLYQEGKRPEALPIAERAYRLAPESGSVADTYGWILYQNGHVKDGLPILEKAWHLEPRNGEIRGHLIEAYKASGQEAKASDLLEETVTR
ncbi:tetratricopeptide repeat protein [Marinobacter pelagius]|nr:tetratricopeptide repeat protein [Marinobacter sp. C7]